MKPISQRLRASLATERPNAKTETSRCVAPGCHRRLFADQQGVCCEGHRKAVISDIRRMISLLRLPDDDFRKKLKQYRRRSS
jgi:hypothetical protein